MKYLFLLLITLPVFACQINVPTSDVQRYIEAMPNGVAPLYSCKDKPEEKCHCADNIQWEFAELVDNEVIDYIAKSNEIACVDELDCDAKFIEISCNLEEEKIKNYDLLQVYCVKNIMKIEGKKLAESPNRKAAHLAAKEAKKIAKDAKIAKKLADKVELFALKKADIDAMTVSQRNAVMIKLINIVQEIEE
jgi:hypothetical protein